MTGATFFKRTSTSEQDPYWTTYLAARPKYHRSGFYERILAYHREHGNASFDLAHDIACGPSQVAAELCRHFNKVMGSDVNAEHVDVARARLTGANNISFLTASSEKITLHAEPQSVDLLTVARAMPLIDMSASLFAFHTMLKTGGTLAMWFYGRPHFLSAAADDDGGETLDTAVNAAYTALADFMFMPHLTDNKSMWQAPCTHMHSWFDNMAIPATDWAHVERRKWGFDCEMPFYNPMAGGLDGVVPESRVGAHEKCMSVVDRSFWREDWTAEEAEKFLQVNMPIFDPEVYDGEGYARLCGELERAMGGTGVRRWVVWPVILILGTRQ